MPVTLPPTVERTAPPKDLELRPKQVKAWLEALPRANPVDAARMVLGHVAALNRAKVELDVRLDLLKLHRDTAHGLFDELDAIYGKSPVPLGAKARDALSIARDLAAELALGFRIALAEKTGKLISFGAKKQLPILVYRALEQCIVVLRASYRAYSPVPEGVWRELHALYLYADQEGVAAEAVDPESKTSVADLYAEWLLVALTDPYRLAVGEVDRILAQLRVVRADVPLAQKVPATPRSAHFLVPCDTDKPPKPALSASDDRGGPNWRLLDANALVEKLRTRRNALEAGQVSAATAKALGPDGATLLAKLITLWGDPPKRTSRRDPMDTSVAICAGIKAIGHFVALEPDPAAEKAKIHTGLTIPLLSIPDDAVSRSLPVAEWAVVNQSAGGLKVRRERPAPHAIGVGEVVGVKLLGRARWTVGVVRWITALDEGAVEFGIQFLASAARVVSIQPTITAATTPPKMALLLGEEEEGAKASLLVPPGTYSDLREFELGEPPFSSLVRATALVEKTPRFELFEVTPS